MIYINKKSPSHKIQDELNTVKRSNDWKNANDSHKVRACFDALTVKKDIQYSLAEEQHYICAYCMKKIQPEKHVKIEHFLPLSDMNNKDMALDYKNFLLCCHGGENNNCVEKRVLCCDSNKKDVKITLDPTKSYLMQNIKYRKDGKIYYNDPKQPNTDDTYNREINSILHLNGNWDEINDRIIQDTSTNIVKGRKEAFQKANLILKKNVIQ